MVGLKAGRALRLTIQEQGNCVGTRRLGQLPRGALLVEHALLEQRKAAEVGRSVGQNFAGRRHLDVDAVEPLLEALLRVLAEHARLVAGGGNHVFPVSSPEIFECNKKKP